MRGERESHDTRDPACGEKGTVHTLIHAQPQELTGIDQLQRAALSVQLNIAEGYALLGLIKKLRNT